MGEQKQLKAKVVFKHETEANWLKSAYTPAQAEIVIYDIEVDENGETIGNAMVDTPTGPQLPEGRRDPYSYERQKIGDGIHNINELPFLASSGIGEQASVRFAQEGCFAQAEQTAAFGSNTYAGGKMFKIYEYTVIDESHVRFSIKTDQETILAIKNYRYPDYSNESNTTLYVHVYDDDAGIYYYKQARLPNTETQTSDPGDSWYESLPDGMYQITLEIVSSTSNHFYEAELGDDIYLLINRGPQFGDTIYGNWSFTSGMDNMAIGLRSAAFGRNNYVAGNTAVGWGHSNNVMGAYSIGFGVYNTVQASTGVAIGRSNSITPSGNFGVAIGKGGSVSAENGVAIHGKAKGKNAVAIGDATIANSYQVVMGSYNKELEGRVMENGLLTQGAAFIVGIGRNAKQLKNGLVVYGDGRVEIGAAPVEDKDAVTKKYFDDIIAEWVNSNEAIFNTLTPRITRNSQVIDTLLDGQVYSSQILNFGENVDINGNGQVKIVSFAASCDHIVNTSDGTQIPIPEQYLTLEDYYATLFDWLNEVKLEDKTYIRNINHRTDNCKNDRGDNYTTKDGGRTYSFEIAGDNWLIDLNEEQPATLVIDGEPYEYVGKTINNKITSLTTAKNNGKTGQFAFLNSTNKLIVYFFPPAKGTYKYELTYKLKTPVIQPLETIADIEFPVVNQVNLIGSRNGEYVENSYGYAQLSSPVRTNSFVQSTEVKSIRVLHLGAGEELDPTAFEDGVLTIVMGGN